MGLISRVSSRTYRNNAHCQLKMSQSSNRSSLTTVSPLENEKVSHLEKIEENFTENKENIRPTIKGRNTKCLKKQTLISEDELQTEKYELESKLRSTYDAEGNLNVNEKLAAYKNLISFYEEHDLSTQIRIRDLMSQLVKDREIYKSKKLDKDDPFYMYICIRLGRDFCNYDRAKSMISFLQFYGFGQKTLEFYIFAAQFYQEAKHFDLAEEIFNKGLYNIPGNAKLLAHYENFKTAKEMYELEKDERQKNGFVGNEGEVKTKKTVGNTRFNLKSCSKKDKVPHKNVNLANQIYQDNDGEPQTINKKWAGNMPSEINDIENQQSCSKWKADNSLKGTFAVKNHGQNLISVYQDTDDSQNLTESENKRKINKKMEGILNKQKNDLLEQKFGNIQVPGCQDSKDKTEKKVSKSKQKIEYKPVYMYPKEQCKSGTTYFSLEELRLLNYHQISKINKCSCERILESEREK